VAKNKPSLKREKEKTWKAFSTYIRTRDCIRTTGDPTKGSCITCNKPFSFKDLQAGHAIGGRNNAVLFDEEIVYAQCIGDNVYKGGAYPEYALILIRKHGDKWFEEKLKLKSKAVKYTIDDLVKLREHYEEKTRQLLLNI
jgi:hypothetical protein